MKKLRHDGGVRLTLLRSNAVHFVRTRRGAIRVYSYFRRADFRRLANMDEACRIQASRGCDVADWLRRCDLRMRDWRDLNLVSVISTMAGNDGRVLQFLSL